MSKRKCYRCCCCMWSCLSVRFWLVGSQPRRLPFYEYCVLFNALAFFDKHLFVASCLLILVQKQTFALYTVQVRSTVLYLHQYNTIIWFFIDLTSIWCVFAAAICSMLDDWTGMDKLKAKEYILNCQVDLRKFRMHHILHWDTCCCNAYCLIFVVIICSHMMAALVWFLVLNLMVSNFIWPFYLLLYIFIIFIWRT